MPDTFLSQTHCDRCPTRLVGRTMSWFTEETICMECSKKEQEVKAELKKQGKNPADYEGCGYIPILEEI